MTSLKRKESGFTIVELLIVIVVIGILAALVIVTFTGIQQKGRDTERKTDIVALHSQLEAYNASNGKYPTKANLDDSAWVAANLKGLDKESTRDPKNTVYTFAAAATANQYAYDVTAADGTTACDNTTTDCAKYKLIATLENGGTTFEKDSLN